MSPTQAARLNSRGTTVRLAMFPATLTFAPSTVEWAVAMGPVRNSRQMPEHGQAFQYFRTALVHFPRSESFRPKLGEVFTRSADIWIPFSTNWRVEEISDPPNDSALKLTAERID